MCRLRRLKSFFALRHSTCHLHLISTWVILIETNVQGMHDLSNFKIQLSHDDFKHEVIFFSRPFFWKFVYVLWRTMCMLRFWGVHAHVEPGEELKLWCNSPCLTWTPALRIVQSASKLIQTNLTLMKKLVSTFLILREFLVILQNFGFWMYFGSSWIHWEQRLLPSLIAHMPPI